MFPSPKRSDRAFFSFFALYYLVTMTVAFTRSTAQVISEQGGLRTIAIVHSVLGTIWLALYVTQTLLIRGERRRLHERLGIAGVPVMVGVFITGVLAVLRLHLPLEELPAQLVRSELALFTLALIYAVMGIANRSEAAAHKRYMLMSMVLLSPAGMGRLLISMGFQVPDDLLVFLLVIFAIPLLSILVYDLVAYRKVCRATWVGLLLYIVHLVVGPSWGALIVDHIRPLLA